MWSRTRPMISPVRDRSAYDAAELSCAPVASGWSVRRLGLAHTGKGRRSTTHTQTGHQRFSRSTTPPVGKTTEKIVP
jgi:hypothetical protein